MQNLMIFICYAIEALTLLVYCNLVFNSKKSKHFILCIILCSYLFLFITHSMTTTLGYSLNVVKFSIVNFCIIFFLFKTRFYVALLHAILITFYMDISEFLFCNVFANFSSESWNNWNNAENLFIVLLSKITFFVLSVITAKIIRNKKLSPSTFNKGTGIIILMCFCIYSILFTLYTVITKVPYNSTLEAGIYIILGLILFFMLLAISLYTYNQKRGRELIDLKSRQQREEFRQEYFQSMHKKDEAQRIFIHDIKNHLMVINALNNNENVKITDYITALVGSISFRMPSFFSSNQLLNIILSKYNDEAATAGINITFDIRYSKFEFMTDNSLTALFCNILDNAIEACSVIENSFIELQISKPTNTSLVRIVLINSCINRPEHRGGFLMSTKNNPNLHGYGLRSVTNIVELYNGEMNVYVDNINSTFHTIILLNGESNENNNL